MPRRLRGFGSTQPAETAPRDRAEFEMIAQLDLPGWMAASGWHRGTSVHRQALGAVQMLLRDPDGRHVKIQAPLSASAGDPAADS